MNKPEGKRAAFTPLAERSAEEKYAVMDQALTNVLRAAKATVSDNLVEYLVIYERCLKGVLGMPTEDAN